MTVATKPGHRGEREVSRKTIARGMPGLFRCDRGDYARVLCFISHARLRVHQAPGIPCALCFLRANDFAKLGRVAPRECGVTSSNPVIARSKATKQSTLTSRRNGLLRFARNDGRLKMEPEIAGYANALRSRPLPRDCGRRSWRGRARYRRAS